MDLYIAIGIPPYNWLLSGKLIALISLSNEIREIFKSRYSSSKYLGLITTSSLYGRNCSQYNRIKFEGINFFSFIGETKGYGHIHIPDDIYENMKYYLKISGIEISHDIAEDFNYKFKIISRTIRSLGLSESRYLNHNIKKGIFVSPLAINCKEYLLGKDKKPDFYNIPLDKVIDFWKERWLSIRINNHAILRKVYNFKKDNLRVSNLLKKYYS